MEQELNFTHEDITGEMSVKLANDQTLDDFCAQHIADYNRDRFEALAIRLYVGAETIITVYAVDKTRQENNSLNNGKVPVKKFKIETLPASSLFSYCEGFNCTLSTGNFALEDMEVINK
jgi:hypothetical protein